MVLNTTNIITILGFFWHTPLGKDLKIILPIVGVIAIVVILCILGERAARLEAKTQQKPASTSTYNKSFEQLYREAKAERELFDLTPLRAPSTLEELGSWVHYGPFIDILLPAPNLNIGISSLRNRLVIYKHGIMVLHGRTIKIDDIIKCEYLRKDGSQECYRTIRYHSEEGTRINFIPAPPTTQKWKTGAIYYEYVLDHSKVITEEELIYLHVNKNGSTQILRVCDNDSRFNIEGIYKLICESITT